MNTLIKFDRAIAFNRVFVNLTGTITGALFLSQAVYWQKRCKSEDGWWWKTQQDWTDETGMTRHELGSARDAAKQFVEHKRAGVPCRSFWRVDADAIEAAVTLLEDQSSLPESGELVCDASEANQFAGKRQTTNKTEITSYINGAEASKNPKRQLTDGWSAAWAARFGGPYDFKGAADGKAADDLLKLYPPEKLLAMAGKAWGNLDEFNCKHAMSLRGFAARFNEIRAEIGELNGAKINGKTNGPSGSKGFDRNKGTANEGRAAAYDHRAIQAARALRDAREQVAGSGA